MYEESKNIISVCVVRGEDNFINRIADVCENELVVPEIDRSNNFGKGFNRDRLFYDIQKEPFHLAGHMGVWRWGVSPHNTRPDKDWVNSECLKDLRPIEILELFRDKTKEEMITFLREEALPPCNHRRLFLFCNGSRKQGVLCDPFELEQTDRGVRLKDNVYILPCYDIKESDILRTQWTQDISERCLYRFLQLPQNSGYISVRSPEKAVKFLLMKRLNKRFVLDHGGTREDFKTFRRLMEALPDQDITMDIAGYCHCSEPVAEACWHIFKDHVGQFVRCEDIESQVLRGLLEKDEMLKERLHNEWRNAHQQALEREEAEYNQLRAGLEEQLDTQKKERTTLETDFAKLQQHQQVALTRMQRETEEANACLSKAREEAEHYEVLSREGLRLVREKLCLAREEAAEFLADLALFGSPKEAVASASFTAADRSVLMARFLPGTEPKEWETVDDVETLLEELWENLLRAGVDRKRVRELAAFLFGAFQNNTALLLAGPQGAVVADALSCTMVGRCAAVLDCCGEWNPAVLDDVKTGTDSVIIVKRPFQNRWIDHLLPEITAMGKMWIFVHPYADDLPLEPSGLYQYVLPLVLDVFMHHPATGEMVCCQKGKGYKELARNEDIRSRMKPLRKLSSNRYLETKVNQMMSISCAIKEKGDEAFLWWGCLLFPLALAFGRKDIFLETAQSDSSLSQEDKTFLEGFFGEIR